MRREEHVIDGVFATRFEGPDPDHALLVFHGMGGHGALYDVFCEHHARRGVDVWSLDLPGFGRTHRSAPRGRFDVADWVEAGVAVADHIAEETGLPVVAKGSSLGVMPAYAVAQESDAVPAAVLMGYAVPGLPAAKASPWRSDDGRRILAEVGETARFDIARFIDFDEDYGYRGALDDKRADPLSTWFFDLASYATLFTYDPAVDPADNTVPLLFTVGEHDPISTPEIVRAVASLVGGPVEVHEHPGGAHQLMLYHAAEYSPVVVEWCRRVIADEEARP